MRKEGRGREKKKVSLFIASAELDAREGRKKEKKAELKSSHRSAREGRKRKKGRSRHRSFGGREGSVEKGEATPAALWKKEGFPSFFLHPRGKRGKKKEGGR